MSEDITAEVVQHFSNENFQLLYNYHIKQLSYGNRWQWNCISVGNMVLFVNLLHF